MATSPTTGSKRRRRDGELVGEPPPLPVPRLSAEKLADIIAEFNRHSEKLLNWLANEKETPRKVALNEAIQCYNKRFSEVASAYSSLLVVHDFHRSVAVSLNNACSSVNQASAALASLTQSASINGRSFASVAAQPGNANVGSPAASSRARKVALPRAKSFPLTNSTRVVIGPSEQAKDRYPSANDTKKAILSCIDPVRLKMNVNRVSFGPNSAVIVEGDAINSSALSNCPALANAGFELKPDVKFNPRVIVHDVPTELSVENVISCLIEQNLPETSAADYKPIYIYPARDKKLRSCVIETNPDIRAALLNRKKACVRWSMCRVDDHITILQCFKCNGFGHVSTNCTKNVTCGKCAGNHETKNCTPNSILWCVNCSAANISDHSHAATDRSRCTILRNKIKHKISCTNYGE